MEIIALETRFISAQIDGCPSRDSNRILKNASAGGKNQKNHSLVIKNSNLIKVGTNENPAMVASSTLILAFLNIWDFHLKP